MSGVALKAKSVFGVVGESWRTFSPSEKRNIAIYILGIMLYKFGLEAFNGSITALATNRYDQDAFVAGVRSYTFYRVGLLQGLNQAFQCVGSILIAPLIKRFPTKNVLAVAIFVFGIFTAVLLIVDGATGGRFIPAEQRGRTVPANRPIYDYYGRYNTDGIIPIYCVTGVAYGMVELIRRVIPRDIVGGNVQKLRRMDALVHIFYEIAGTSGAFCTALALIPQFGNNMSFVITPPFFAAASAVWYMISDLGFKGEHTDMLKDKPTYFRMAIGGFYLFLESVYTGGKIIFSKRKFIWLLPGYAIALYGHRYLENGISPIVARRYLNNSAWSQIMVGGSNFGELLGAACVFLFTNLIHTPMPWLRLDSLTLLIVWYLPYWYSFQPNDVRYAWVVAATFVPVSFGWAAGDVSLAAYIQASLARVESKTTNVSALGAVMAFLYVTYIILYAILSPVLGSYIDSVFNATGGSNGGGTVRPALVNIAGVQFTVICIVVISATFIPKGSFAFNPKMISDELLDHDIDEAEDHSAGSDDEKELKKGGEELHVPAGM